METERKAPTGFVATPETSNSYWFMGSLLTFLATGKQTDNQFALFEATVRKEYEVPPHTHSKEDESFYILEGEVVVTLGENTFHGKAGDLIFLPRNIQHSWKSLTDPARFLVWISPAGSEAVFLAFSEPAPRLELPPPTQEPPNEELLMQAVAMDNEYGVVYAFQTKNLA